MHALSVIMMIADACYTISKTELFGNVCRKQENVHCLSDVVYLIGCVIELSGKKVIELFEMACSLTVLLAAAGHGKDLLYFKGQCICSNNILLYLYSPCDDC